MKQLQYKDKDGNWQNIVNTANTKEWYGTQAQYDALGTYDENTKYYILED